MRSWVIYSNTPPDDKGPLRFQLECSDKLLMCDVGKHFSENVGKVVFRWNLYQPNLPLSYVFPYIVVSDLGVLCMCVSLGVKGEGNGGCIISVQDSWELAFEAHLRHK